jgi:hypothetical protein
MSTRAHRICRPSRYRPAPIRAAFALCHHVVHFHVRCRHRIWRDRAATDSFSDGVIWTTNLIDSRGFLPRGLSDACPLNPDEYP